MTDLEQLFETEHWKALKRHKTESGMSPDLQKISSEREKFRTLIKTACAKAVVCLESVLAEHPGIWNRIRLVFSEGNPGDPPIIRDGPGLYPGFVLRTSCDQAVLFFERRSSLKAANGAGSEIFRSKTFQPGTLEIGPFRFLDSDIWGAAWLPEFEPAQQLLEHLRKLGSKPQMVKALALGHAKLRSK